jgi:hypothetical protein
MHDDGIPSEQVLDDQAEVILGEHNFPAVGFQVAGTAFTFHPGEAAAALEALGKAKQVRLRSDGAGLDSGPIDINLPQEALNWLKACGRTFDIAVDKVTDPDAPAMPAPRPRSPKTQVSGATKAGPPGIEDKQKIDGWDASELRNNEGQIIVCFIRRHYYTGSEPGSRHLATFLMVSRRKGLTMMLKDSNLHLQEQAPVEATLTFGETPFSGFTAQAQGRRRDRNLSGPRRRAGEGAGERHARADEIACVGQFRIPGAGKCHSLAACLRPPQWDRDRAGRAISASSGDVGPRFLRIGRERIEIDEARIVGGNLYLRSAVAMDVHQRLHASCIHVVDMLMP